MKNIHHAQNAAHVLDYTGYPFFLQVFFIIFQNRMMFLKPRFYF